MVCEQCREQMENVVGPATAGDQDCYALLGVFIDDAQHPEGSAIVCPGLDEVAGPDVVGPTRPETDA